MIDAYQNIKNSEPANDFQLAIKNYFLANLPPNMANGNFTNMAQIKFDDNTEQSQFQFAGEKTMVPKIGNASSDENLDSPAKLVRGRTNLSIAPKSGSGKKLLGVNRRKGSLNAKMKVRRKGTKKSGFAGI